MEEKKLRLPSVIATGVGLIVATNCLLLTGQGASSVGLTFIIAMVIACVLNMFTALSLSELNAVMPNITGGLAQYTLAGMGPLMTIIFMVGGYLVANTAGAGAECAMFGNTMLSLFPGLKSVGLSGSLLSILAIAILLIVNLNGVDMFAKIQDFVAYALIISLMVMGVLGTIKAAPGTVVTQPAVLSSKLSDISGLCGAAFFLFIGCEYVIPISDKIANSRKNVPLGMMLSLGIICAMQIFLVIGMKNYTPWKALGTSTTPHILYGSLLMGPVGKYWMGIVSICAVISTVNTVMSGLPFLAQGMAKIGLLPEIFMKTNKKGAPYFGIVFFGAIMIVINAFDLSTSSALSFVILSGCVFEMLNYVVAHIDVMIFRKRLPQVPRTFKVPGGFVIPVLSIAGTLWMVWNISGDPAERLAIFRLVGIIFAALAAFAVVWIKKVMKKPMMKPYPVEDVMAMDNELYAVYHDPKTGKLREKADKMRRLKAVKAVQEAR
ncbi:MAG: APC family permease [Pseudoramibacter sp.]